MAIKFVHSEDDVSDLVANVLDTTRDHVVCVVSIPLSHDQPLFDPLEVQAQSAGICDVWVIPTGDLTRALTSQLPNNADCYGGAARIYPISMEWTNRPKLSKRIMPPDALQISTAMDALITEIHTQAFLSGLMARRTALTRPASGIVTAFLSDDARALVRLDNDALSTVAQELTAPEVPLSNILRLGQRVDGMLDHELNRLILDIPNVTESDVLEHFGAGAVTLGVVTEVARQWGSVALYPGMAVRLEQRDVSSNSKDLVDVLYAVGDVIRVRVIRTPQGRLGLRTLDIDDDEDVLPAYIVVGGGPEWLNEDQLNWLPVEQQVTESIESFLSRIGLEREEPREPDKLSEPQSTASPDNRTEREPHDSRRVAAATRVPSPGPGPKPAIATGPIALPGHSLVESQSLTILQLRARVDELERTLAQANPRGMKVIQDQMRLEIAELFEDRDSLRAQLRAEKGRTTELRAQVRDAKLKRVVGNDYSESRTWFASNADGATEWIRHEVHLAWIERMPANERSHRSLAQYALSEDFAASLDEFTNGQKHKAFKCIVDVLVGTPELLALRKVHPLRAHDGANSGDRIRDDGAAAMRAYIEEGVASARRLHYWKLIDGTIELANVSVHDDIDV